MAVFFFLEPSALVSGLLSAHCSTWVIAQVLWHVWSGSKEIQLHKAARSGDIRRAVREGKTGLPTIRYSPGLTAAFHSLVHDSLRRAYFGAADDGVLEEMSDLRTVVAQLVGITKGAHC